LLLKNPRQLRHAGDQMRLRLMLELIPAMSARKHAHIPAGTGIMTGLQIKRRVADHCDFVNTVDFGQIHAAEDQQRRRPPAADFIAADHTINDAVFPAERRNQ